MDVYGYTVTRKQVGILLGCIGLLCVGIYFTVPAVQASIHSTIDAGEVEYDASYDQPYAYSSFVIESTSDHDGHQSFKMYYNDSKMHFNGDSTDVYAVPSEDGLTGKVLMKTEHSEAFETISSHGQFIQQNGQNITYMSAYLSSGNRVEYRILTVSHGPFELEGAKYEKTGTKQYHNRTVDVYKKTWTSMGLPTVFNDDVVYVDSKTGMVLYADVKMNDAYQNKKLNLKDFEYAVEPTDTEVQSPDWTDKVTFYDVNNSTQFTGHVTNDSITYDGPSVLEATLDFEPYPIEPNSTLTITTEKNGEVIGSDTARASVVANRFHITPSGKIVSHETIGDPNDVENGEYIQYNTGDTVTLHIEAQSGNQSLRFKNFDTNSYEYTSKVSVTNAQTYFDNSITRENGNLIYTIHHAYSPYNPTIQYGEQQKQPTEKTIYQYPKPENNSLVFTENNSVTHFTIITEDDGPKLVLEPLPGEKTSTGTIKFAPSILHQIDDSNITLTQNNETIAKMEVLYEAGYITNVPTGNITIHIETDEGNTTKTVTVEENTNVFVGDSEDADPENDTEPVQLAHDAGQRPATYGSEPTQFFKSFTGEELNFSEDVMTRTNYTVQNQEDAKPDEYSFDKTFNINSTITQSDGQTHITIHSITNASADEKFEQRRGELQLYYGGEEKEVRITNTTVDKTVTFNMTNDSYAEFRYWQSGPTHMRWSSAIYIVDVTEDTTERGWVYFEAPGDNYKMYNDDRELVLDLNNDDMNDLDRGPLRIYAPVDEYAVVLEAEHIGTSYRTFPITENNRTTLPNVSMLGRHVLEYDENNPEVERSPFSTDTTNKSGNRTITFKYTNPDANGTATIIYGNQTKTVELSEYDEENFTTALQDTNARYVKIFYSPEYTTNVTHFDIHRTYPEGKGIDNWYMYQNNGTIRVYDWATQVAEFKYTVMLETGPQSRYHPRHSLGYRSSQTTSDYFGNTLEVKLVDSSTKSVNNTTTTNE